MEANKVKQLAVLVALACLALLASGTGLASGVISSVSG
jgi:hypothetical protein